MAGAAQLTVLTGADLAALPLAVQELLASPWLGSMGRALCRCRPADDPDQV